MGTPVLFALRSSGRWKPPCAVLAEARRWNAASAAWASSSEIALRER